MRSSISSSSVSVSGADRLTASDRPGVAQPVPERPVPDLPWRLLFVTAIAAGSLLVGGWELYWRDFGVKPSFRDDDASWAIQRRRIDTGDGDATVLIGASRTLFDTQLPVWEKLSGRRPIQLAIAGTTPLFALEDLADDPRFEGRLIVGIAPDVFFSGHLGRKDVIKYLRQESPSERVGKWLSMHFVEPGLAFYDPDFALFKVIRRQNWPLRPGRTAGTAVRKLGNMEQDRNTHLWDKVELDPQYRGLWRSIWADDFHDPAPTPAEAAEQRKTLEEQIARAATAVKKLKARGVPVIFVRPPSSGEYLAYERRDFPRPRTWDALMTRVGVPGIHFEDYPELQGFDLPDWSHMTTSSAERYTEALYGVIEAHFGRAAGVHW